MEQSVRDSCNRQATLVLVPWVQQSGIEMFALSVHTEGHLSVGFGEDCIHNDKFETVEA